MGMKRAGLRSWCGSLAAPIALVLSLAALLAGGAPAARAQEGVCDSAPSTRLAIGQWAIVTDVVASTSAGGLRLRDEPRTSSTEVDLLTAGTQVRVIDGPACNDGLQWYYLSVQPGGLEGWSAEAIPGSYYLAPSAAPPGETLPPPVFATNTPLAEAAPGITLIPGNVTGNTAGTSAGTAAGACPDDPLPSYLRVGAQARAADQAHPVRLRPTPEIDGIFTEMVYQDKVLEIVEGPLCADGLTWWRVSVEGRPGWTVESAGDRYLLIDPANAPPQIVTGTLSEIPPSPTPSLDVTPLPTIRPQTPPAVDKRAVYTPDGTRLAVGAQDGVRLYDAASFALQTTLPSGPVLDFVTIGGALFAVGWAPEGITLTGVPDGTIRTVLVNAPSDPAWAAAAPDGRWLILGPTSDGATATLWDLDNARPALIPPFWWPGWGVIEAAFSPDNRYVLVNDVVSLRRCETAGPGCLFDLVRNDFLPAGIFGDVAWIARRRDAGRVQRPAVAVGRRADRGGLYPAQHAGARRSAPGGPQCGRHAGGGRGAHPAGDLGPDHLHRQPGQHPAGAGQQPGLQPGRQPARGRGRRHGQPVRSHQRPPLAPGGVGDGYWNPPNKRITPARQGAVIGGGP